MLDLLQVPLRKLSGYRGFWRFLAVALILTFLGIWALARVDLSAMGGAPELSTQRFFTFPLIWSFVPWLLKLTGYFLSSMMILLICHDMDNGLLRQHVIDGWSRERILASYILLSLVFVVGVLIILFACGAIFGVKSGQEYFNAQAIEAIFGFTLHSFLTFQFAILLSLLIKKAVICLVAFLSWPLLCEPILGAIFKSLKLDVCAEYLPFTVIDNLMPSIRSLLPQVFSGQVGVNSGVDLAVILASIAYFFMFSGISWFTLRQNDL